MREFTSLKVFLQDLRFGSRILRRSPGFTVLTVLSLAIGIGANVAIFSVIDEAMIKHLPVRNPEQLVTLGSQGRFYFPYPHYTQLRDRSQAFSGMFAILNTDRSNIIVNGTSGLADHLPAHVQLVSGSYFSVLGVNAILGRILTVEDDRTPGAHPVTVISAEYWKRRFAQAPDVVGRTLTLNATTYSIIGVTPPGFSGDMVGHPADLWIPMAMQAQVMLERSGLLTNPRAGGVRIVARLQPGVDVAQARAQAETILRQLQIEDAGSNPTPEILSAIAKTPVELQPELRGFAPERASFARPLLILWVIASLVLLITCANVANLLLARASARKKEIAVRMAIGASRRRIIWQLLTESILLAFLGGALGLLLAYWGVQVLINVVASSLTPLYLEPALNARTFGFTAAVCLAVGILFGLAPALRSTRIPLISALKDRAAKALGARRGRYGMDGFLVVVQVALSLLLLIGAGLFVGTLRNLKTTDLGFDRDHILLVWIAPAQAGRAGAPLAKLCETIEQRVGQLQGVRSASVSNRGVLGITDTGSPVTVQGYTPRPNDKYFVPWSLVGAGFFETIGTSLLYGRDFTPQDNETSRRVAIINEPMARHYFGVQNPVGKRFGMRREGPDAIEIVGVVRGAKYNSLREQDEKMIYLPYRQEVGRLTEICLVVRTHTDPERIAGTVRRALGEIDQSLPVTSIASVNEQLDRTLVLERLMAILSGFFGVMALLLASIGLYGTLSYSVARRTNEIGIRLALGATPANILRMILQNSLLMVGSGIVIGLVGALAIIHLITSMFFGVRAIDPSTISFAVLILLIITFLASYVPARRATKVDPLVSLRDE